MEEEVLEMELLPAQITVVVGRMSTVHHGVRLGALPLVAANQFFVSDVYEMVAYWLEVECDLKNVCFRLSYDAAEDASQGPNWVKLASPISLANLARLHVVVEEVRRGCGLCRRGRTCSCPPSCRCGTKGTGSRTL